MSGPSSGLAYRFRWEPRALGDRAGGEVLEVGGLEACSNGASGSQVAERSAAVEVDADRGELEAFTEKRANHRRRT